MFLNTGCIVAPVSSCPFSPQLRRLYRYRSRSHTFWWFQFHDLKSACVSMFLYPTFSLLACSSADSFLLACGLAPALDVGFFCLAAKRLFNATCCFARIFAFISGEHMESKFQVLRLLELELVLLC